jgi:hypothetical protein
MRFIGAQSQILSYMEFIITVLRCAQRYVRSMPPAFTRQQK